MQVFTLLLKTNRVYEKHKGRMRLLENGTYPGLTSLMCDLHEISGFMARHMLEQVLQTGEFWPRLREHVVLAVLSTIVILVLYL